MILNVILQGFTYGIAVIGISIALRVLRYPDLTADGSFLLGAVVFANLLQRGYSWELGMLAAIVVGGLAGVVTALLHLWFGVGRLLSGILTTMACYSIGFRVVRGQATMDVDPKRTMFAGLNLFSEASAQVVVAIITVMVISASVLWLLRSELGLVLRATGDNRPMVRDQGHHPARYEVAGLFIANSLVAVSGVLLSAEQHFVEIGMGVGIIVPLIAALILGEQVVRLRALWAQQCGAPVIGASLYFLLYISILRAAVRGWLPVQVQSTDLKMIAAATVALAILVRRLRNKSDRSYGDVLPL